MTADFGPCSSWVPLWTCDVSTESPTATGNAVSAATYILWSLSGRQFGTCQVTLRPCRKECYDTSWWNSYGLPWTTSWDYAGSSYPWFSLGCGACRGTCSCTELSEVVLPSPVNSIVQVKLDGAPVTGIYRLDDNRFLVRTDGQFWPRCNNLTKDDTQAGTWSITATYGQTVPVAGQLAVGELACEILKAMNGEDCRLPAGVTQLVRQGVTISYPDVGELLSKGRTGLYLVDSFIHASNPYNLRQRARIYSPDQIRHRRPS